MWTIVNIPPGQRQQIHNTRLGDAMRKLGWERVRQRFIEGGYPTYGYARGGNDERAIRIHVSRDDLGELTVSAEPPVPF